ncbi:MAG: DegT/DnrJ/EryC1/StrS family aminotransferase [Chitinivibrionales bacterium]|nr:DegT/DnrJ/EryC1/StrS family aminotransferase [Chitinivibrionales bacterium]
MKTDKLPIIIHHSRPFVGQEEKRAVAAVIDSGQLAAGPQVAALERELAGYVGHRYGLAVSSGTAALYLALRALDINKSSKVLMPSYVCTALLHAALFCGAKPVFSDINPETGCIDDKEIAKAIRPGVAAIIVPHLFGYPVDAAAIQKRFGIPVIEDCAQCVGATRGKNSVGGMTALSVFSFYATKLLAAGEGGLAATSDKKIADRIKELREYDKRDSLRPAFNFKLSDVHAAIARAQLKKIRSIIDLRRKIARRYLKAFEQSPKIVFPVVEAGTIPVYYRFVARVNNDLPAIINKMNSKGIECGRPVYRPLHLYYKKKSGFKTTMQWHASALSIPIYPGLAHAESDRVLTALQESL